MLCASYSGNPREGRYWPVSQSASSPVRWPATESNQIKLESHSVSLHICLSKWHHNTLRTSRDNKWRCVTFAPSIWVCWHATDWYFVICLCRQATFTKTYFSYFFLLCKNSLNFRCHQLETDLNYYQWRQCLSQP